LRLTRSATRPGVLVEPIQVCLAELNAEEVLAQIEAGEVGFCVLSFVVLMQGSGVAEVIERWKRLVERETDLEKRSKYRYFALEFAELTAGLVNWQNVLEGWEVRESQYINSIEDRGVLRKGRADILEVLEFRLQSPVPEEIRLAVNGTNDLPILDRWLRTASIATSYDDFLAAMNPH
jgi:hypothetical protein